jgi:hypothetical protein
MQWGMQLCCVDLGPVLRRRPDGAYLAECILRECTPPECVLPRTMPALAGHCGSVVEHSASVLAEADRDLAL